MVSKFSIFNIDDSGNGTRRRRVRLDLADGQVRTRYFFAVLCAIATLRFVHFAPPDHRTKTRLREVLPGRAESLLGYFVFCVLLRFLRDKNAEVQLAENTDHADENADLEFGVIKQEDYPAFEIHEAPGFIGAPGTLSHPSLYSLSLIQSYSQVPWRKASAQRRGISTWTYNDDALGEVLRLNAESQCASGNPKQIRAPA